MRLTEVRHERRDGLVRLVGTVVRENHPPFELYFEFEAEWAPFLRAAADPFAAVLLVPAMYWHEDLTIDPPVSPRLLTSLPELQSIFLSWYPQMRRAVLGLSPAGSATPEAAGVGTFFSGGVDSFYTLLKRREVLPSVDSLTHLIHMQGVETPLENTVGEDASLSQVRAVAKHFGLGCVTGRTNARTFFPWHYEKYFVGSLLAAVGLALGHGFRRVFIPSSRGYHNLKPGGSTVLTDPLFSTEYTRIIYDGAEASRSDKTAAILRWDAESTLAFLRVCMDNNGGAFNCGRCYKCVRTLLALTILGRSDLGRLFESTDRGAWPTALMADHFDYLREHLGLAKAHDTDPQLTAMIQRAIDQRERSAALHTFVKHSPPLRATLPLLRRLREALGREARDRLK